MISSWTHAHWDHWLGSDAGANGKKMHRSQQFDRAKISLHRTIAIDPPANILEFRAHDGRHNSCLRCRVICTDDGTEHPMPISSVTGFSPVTSAVFPQNTGSAASASASKTTSQGNSVVQDFLDYAKMTPAERMREEILKSLGLTEQQFKQLSPAQQQAVNQKIQQIMLQQLQQNSGATGQLVNVSA
jgi:hypothetical protein